MIALVIWFSGHGYIYDYRPTWEDCERAMTLLEDAHVEASCHLVHKEDRR